MNNKSVSLDRIIVGCVTILFAGVFGYWLGQVASNPIAEDEITHAYEERFEEELDSVYQLLSGMIMTQRLNMNLSLKTNHYLEHGFSEDVCVDCLKHYKNIVENMPELPERDQLWFDRIYKESLERALEENPSILETNEEGKQ